MKHAIALGLLSLALAAGAVVNLNAAPILSWAAISFGGVALAYAGLGVRVFGKRPNGLIPLPIKILLLPYLLDTDQP